MALSRRGIALTAFAALASLMLASAPVALGLFTSSQAGGPQTISAGTIAAPSNVAAAQASCRVNKSPEVTVTWTASSTSYVTGYKVERATASGGPYAVVGSVSAGKTSYTDGESLGYSTVYYYRVSAFDGEWSATSATVSLKTLGKSCQ